MSDSISTSKSLYGEMCQKLGLSENCGLSGNELQEMLGLPSLNPSSLKLLDGFPPDRIRGITQEARRLKGRLSSIPFYANGAKKDGDEYWIRLAMSYQGD